MADFAIAADGVRLAFEVIGQGAPVMLVHGFGSSRRQNWQEPGWYTTLTEAGYQVIAMDCRGHGDSDKPHTPQSYGHDVMAGDVVTVLNHAGVNPVFLMGYSMGGFISLHLLMEKPERLRRVVIGGVGETYLQPPGASSDQMADPAVRNRIADALLAPDKNMVTDRNARMFRDFVDQGGKDRFALAACMRAARANFTADALSKSTRPVLVVCGENDALTGSPEPLAAAFANGRAVTVPRRDHMTSVGDKVYKKAVLEFLAED